MTDYQKYQLRWMIDHDYSLYDLLSELTRLQYDDPEDSDRISSPEYVTVDGKKYPAVVRDYYSNISEADASGYYWYE